MTHINIVSNLKLHPQKGLISKDSSGKWVNIHHQQGDLDGACAVYSLMMNLLILGKISINEVCVYSKIDRRTRRGKFLSHFLENQGLIHYGYSYRCLAKEIRDYCPDELNINTKQKLPKSREETIETIQNSIENDLPIIISIDFSFNRGHALLAVGIEYNENNIPIKLLCLDPAVSSPICAKWNCYIDISDYNKSNTPYWYITERGKEKVVLGDMILITMKK